MAAGRDDTTGEASREMERSLRELWSTTQFGAADSQTRRSPLAQARMGGIHPWWLPWGDDVCDYSCLLRLLLTARCRVWSAQQHPAVALVCPALPSRYSNRAAAAVSTARRLGGGLTIPAESMSCRARAWALCELEAIADGGLLSKMC